MGKNNTTYFKNLDGLRTLCFLMVFLFHSFTTTDNQILQSSSYSYIKNSVFGNGNLGVNFFFVLSGFLITYLLLIEQEKKSKVDVLKFWFRRVLRIWPLYFVCVFIGFGVFPMIKSYLGETPQETAHLWTYLTFTSNFDFIAYGRPDASVLGVLWSIAIEEQFYLLWPLLFLLFKADRLWIPMVLLLSGSLIFRLLHPDYFNYEFHSLSCMNDLVVGGLLGWLSKQKTEWLQWICAKGRWILYIAYPIFLLLFFFRDELFYHSDLLKPWEKLITSFAIGLIVIDQAFNGTSPMQLSRFKLISRLGKYTYAMYCLHFVAILIVVTITKKIIGIDTVWSVYLLEPAMSLVLTVVLSYLSYRFLESYFLRLKTKFI